MRRPTWRPLSTRGQCAITFRMPLVFHEYPELRLRITTPEGVAYERASPLMRAEEATYRVFRPLQRPFPLVGHRFRGGA
jgi:hypothetical protein